MSEPARPVYLKLRDLIAAAIIEGRYPEGKMLPSVRAFAAQQGANPLTVAKAYQQFQTDGLVAVQRGVGMYVTPRPPPACAKRNATLFWRRNGPASSSGWSDWASIRWICCAQTLPIIRMRPRIGRSSLPDMRAPRGTGKAAITVRELNL